MHKKSQAKKGSIINFFLSVSFIFLTSNLSAKAIIFKNNQDQIIPLENPANRVISLAPHITELLFHIEQGGKLVGVDSASDYPKAALTIQQVGNHQQINLEKILQLKPDLVIAWKSGSTQPTLDRLKDFNIPVFYTESKTLEGIANTMRDFGSLLGAENIAEQKAVAFEKKIQTIQGNKHQEEKGDSVKEPQTAIKVFYQIWHSPLMTLNGSHIVSEIIRLCGGINIFEGLSIIAPQVSVESVIQANPQLIMSGTHTDINSISAKESTLVKQWQHWQAIDAVKNEQYLQVNSDYLVRATPRVLLGAKAICNKINQMKKPIKNKATY